MRKPWILTCGEQCAKHIPFADTRDWNIKLAFDPKLILNPGKMITFD